MFRVIIGRTYQKYLYTKRRRYVTPLLSENPVTIEGLEYTTSIDRLHYLTSIDRLHFNTREED